jgi:sugar/nucleoside kinase (ribokinase family)
VLGLTAADDLKSGCEALLERGVGCVAATCGSQGAVVADRDGCARVPAFATEIVDTTGCGDAFSAGFLRALSLGRSRRNAAVLGCATAALVAQGRGSDHSGIDLAAADAFAAVTSTIQAPVS